MLSGEKLRIRGRWRFKKPLSIAMNLQLQALFRFQRNAHGQHPRRHASGYSGSSCGGGTHARNDNSPPQ
jgi:hypothetical protein